jgi:VWFA-related protein
MFHRTPMRVLLTAALAVVIAFGPDLTAQEPTFRAGTKLIVQTVSVKDRDGRPIEGLTASDFVLTEDGVPQVISFVEYQRLDLPPDATPAPAAPTAPTVIASDNAAIAPSANGAVKYQDRRLLVLYFDLTALPPPDLSRAYTAARKYINEQRGPRDLIALMAFEGGAVRVKVDFTDDRERLETVLQKMIFGEDADGDGVRDIAVDVGTAFGQDDAEFNILNTDRQLSALQTAAAMLRGVPEQKALVYFGSGLRLNGVDNQAQLRATTNAALRANVVIYPIDARGLVASAPLGNATTQSAGGLSMFTGQMASNMVTQFQRSQDTLYALAKDTGGRPFFDDNDLSLGIRQAAQAQSSYYVIGYYTSSSKRRSCSTTR